ncbi:MAG: hypothetical protein M3Q27_18725, partial [Actinomycetota bacterium]|nr:hypothetical protein [Actinomycetota bacterium]
MRSASTAAVRVRANPADEALLDLATARPALAEERARTVLHVSRDPRERTFAHHALGIVRRDAGDVGAALRALRAGLRLAERHGLHDRAADVAATLGTALALGGKSGEATQSFDKALRLCPDPVATARVRVRRAAVAHWCGGNVHAALDDYRAAVPVLHRHGDLLWEARARINRAWTLLELGDLDSAETDLRHAEEIHTAGSHWRVAAIARNNRAEVARRRGDLPAALHHLDVAAELYAQAGETPPELYVDRARVLLAAGLPADALESARTALTSTARWPAPVRRAATVLS